MKNGFIGSWEYFGEEVFREISDPADGSPPPPDVFVEIGIQLVRVVEKRFFRRAEDLQAQYAEILLAEDSEPGQGEDGQPELTPSQTKFKKLSEELAASFTSFKQPFEAADDADYAGRALDALHYTPLPEFVLEADILTFLEATYELLRDEYAPAWADHFARLIGDFIEKFHLPYKLRPAFRLMPLISAQASRIYELIETWAGPHGDHPELWEAFEEAYYVCLRLNGDKKTPIHKMASYVEAVVADKINEKRGSLGGLLTKYEKLGLFPHQSTISGSLGDIVEPMVAVSAPDAVIPAKASLGKLYGFTSDYPGIRHPGNPPAKNRELTIDDTAMLSFLLFAWSGYLHTLPVDAKA